MDYEKAKKCIKKEFCDNLCSLKKKCCLDKLDTVCSGKHPSTPGVLNHKIRDKAEKAMQRAILGLGPQGIIDRTATMVLGKRKISWIDMELPVVLSEDSRRPCIDLLGISNDKQPVFCELKFTNNPTYHSDCPIYAAMELFNYHSSIKENHKELYKQNIRHQFEEPHRDDPGREIWNDYVNKKPILLVAGNKSYWEYWNKKRTNKKTHTKGICSLETFRQISKIIGVEILPYSFELKEPFNAEENDTYCPGDRHGDISEWSLIK